MTNLDELCGQELENGTVRVRYIEDGSDVAYINDKCGSVQLPGGMLALNRGDLTVNWIVCKIAAGLLGLDVEPFQAKDTKVHIRPCT